MPPTMPVTMPEPVGAPDAIVIPMHNGRATKKTTTEANTSCRRSPKEAKDEDGAADGVVLFIWVSMPIGSL